MCYNTGMTKRIGFACKWIDEPRQVNGIKPKDDCRKYNTGGTTVAWLNRQTREVAEQKLWDLLEYNIEATRLLIERVGTLDEQLRMVRLSSDILPAYTEPNWSYFWGGTDVVAYAERHFARIGELARANNVRLSMHPGQFTVLASDNADIVDRSIDEFEYHTDMARWMGYGNGWHDHGFKINVHISGRRGPAGILAALPRLSPESRNLITIENDENSWGIDASLELADHVALVLDVHHHLINTGGQYIQPDDERCKRIWESWRGVRPVIHYSISREDVLTGHDPEVLPDVRQLLESKTTNKTKLRAHSDDTWNLASNRWVLQFLPHADIQVESKWKNISSRRLWQQHLDGV